MRAKSIIVLLLILLLTNVNPISAVQPAPEPQQNDMGTGEDAGDTFDEATLIDVGNGNGYIHDPIDGRDYYKIPVATGQTIRVGLTSKLDFECNLAIYDAYQQVVDAAEFKNKNPISVSWTFTSPGFCYIKVATWIRQGGTYSLSITLSGGHEPTLEPVIVEESMDFFESLSSIPGFPVYSVIIGILFVAIFLAFKTNQEGIIPYESNI